MTGQVAYRYAQAWLSAARDAKALDALKDDSRSLLSMLDQSPELRAFLASPLLMQNDQSNVMTSLGRKAGWHALTLAMLGLLVKNRRLSGLQDVLQAAKTMLDAESGATRAEITSATPLDAAKISDITQQIAKKFGAQMDIDTRVDPAIIGGLVIRVGSRMIDDSVKSKLDRLGRALRDQSAA